MLAFVLLTTAGSEPRSLALGNCSAAPPPASEAWALRPDGRLAKRTAGAESCVTAVLPVGNGGVAVLAPCGGAGLEQVWQYNESTWAATAPNVSASISLPVHADSPNLGWGLTYDKGGGDGAAVVIYDVATAHSRFHGECTGNHNCNFKLEGGQLHTFSPHGTKQCVVPHANAPPPSPPPTPPPTPALGTALGFSAPAMGDHMVLQRAPAQAAVYGVVGSTSAAAGNAITVTVSGGAAPYTVPATVSADGSSWKVLLRPTPAGGSFTVRVACTAGCSGSAAISDITFGDVWFCSGQSNMALPLLHTFHRNISRAAALAGTFNIRINGLKGNMNADQPWISNAGAAVAGTGTEQSNALFQFSSTCYYFAESLLEEMELSRKSSESSSNTSAAAPPLPPIGLIHTAWGGSQIEAWLAPGARAQCAGTAGAAGSGGSLWRSAAAPYLDTTLKGFLWYQGENNCNGVMGNSAQGVGYGCEMPALVRVWRAAWSATPGTTDPLAPFGVVTLAAGGSEGGPDIGGMRWSQSGNYGTLPSPEMPNAFLAHAYDLGDPWASSSSCQSWGCCWKGYNETACAAKTKPGTCAAACAGLMNTTYYMGPIHPRIKKPVGQRLAKAAHRLLFGGAGAYAGPTLSGCAVEQAASGGGGAGAAGAAAPTITLKFNRTLLRGGSVGVKNYAADAADSAMRVLVDGAYWCANTTLEPKVLQGGGKQLCADVGAPSWGACGGALMCGTDGAALPPSGAPSLVPGAAWVAVDIKAATATTVTLDLAKLNGAAPLALRYAWGQPQDTCCKPAGPTEPCVPGACPLWSPESGLPANPFTAAIVSGKCRCVPPQVCDE